MIYTGNEEADLAWQESPISIKDESPASLYPALDFLQSPSPEVKCSVSRFPSSPSDFVDTIVTLAIFIVACRNTLN